MLSWVYYAFLVAVCHVLCLTHTSLTENTVTSGLHIYAANGRQPFIPLLVFLISLVPISANLVSLCNVSPFMR